MTFNNPDNSRAYCVVKSAFNHKSYVDMIHKRCNSYQHKDDEIKICSSAPRGYFLLGAIALETGGIIWGLALLIVVLGTIWAFRLMKDKRIKQEHPVKTINGNSNPINSRISPKIVPGFTNIRRNKFVLSSQAKKKILKELRFLMEEKKVYRQKGITLEKLARMQGTNRTYLSSVIRDEYGDNFTCFINNYRIKEAIHLLSNPANREPIKAIAENLGYQSLSTFYSAFNKIVKTSPSNYRKLSRTVPTNRIKTPKLMGDQSHV